MFPWCVSTPPATTDDTVDVARHYTTNGNNKDLTILKDYNTKNWQQITFLKSSEDLVSPVTKHKLKHCSQTKTGFFIINVDIPFYKQMRS